VTAPFRDPRPMHDDPEVWPPIVELSPQTIAAYMVQARRMRVEAIRQALIGTVALARKILRR
jgi:hypothetical protein